MLAADLISDTLPVLVPSDTGQQALDRMDVFRVSHLPLVNEKAYLGLVSDKFIEDLNLAGTRFDSLTVQLPAPHVHMNQHIYEVAATLSVLNLSVLPVVNDEHHYAGSILLFDFSKELTRLMSIPEPGGIIILQTTRNNYSASQISQIIEGNDARILSLMVNKISDTDNLEITIKLDRVDLSAVIQTFTRYDYQITAVYMDDSMLHTMYEDRFELFLKYMNI